MELRVVDQAAHKPAAKPKSAEKPVEPAGAHGDFLERGRVIALYGRRRVGRAPRRGGQKCGQQGRVEGPQARAGRSGAGVRQSKW